MLLHRLRPSGPGPGLGPGNGNGDRAVTPRRPRRVVRQDSGGPRERLLGGLRLFLLAAAVLAAVGALGHVIEHWVLLTTTLGPTAYMLLTEGRAGGAQIFGAVLGHATAVACGLAFLAAFGLWSHPSVAEQRKDSWQQVGAQAVAVGLTLALLALSGFHHPPAAATALLITSGIARPGPQLYGMLVGLALLIAGAAALSRVPDPGHTGTGG